MIDKMQSIVAQCTAPGVAFDVKADLGNGERPYLQVRFAAQDAAGGDAREWTGRKWFLSPHMTKSEIVRTAFAAYLAAVEHEARENFRWRERAVFGPHIDVDELWFDARKLEVR
jgi:hypothetical protein